ncbi:MAG: hypothetical protein R3C05_28700 [Pirellulaceae bacterium]
MNDEQFYTLRHRHLKLPATIDEPFGLAKCRQTLNSKYSTGGIEHGGDHREVPQFKLVSISADVSSFPAYEYRYHARFLGTGRSGAMLIGRRTDPVR